MSPADGGRIEGRGELELDRLSEQARAALEWRRRADALRAEGESDGVRATVAGSGALLDLTIVDRACADGGTALVRRVADAISAARLRVGEDVARLCADTFGEQSPQADRVRTSWEQAARRRPRIVGTDNPGGPPGSGPEPRPAGGTGGTW